MLLPFVMAGLVPAISIQDTQRMRQFYVYILASRPGEAIYIGVTSDLARRVFEHNKNPCPATPNDTVSVGSFILKRMTLPTTLFSVSKT
jgi:hypothetical protein